VHDTAWFWSRVACNAHSAAKRITAATHGLCINSFIHTSSVCCMSCSHSLNCCPFLCSLILLFVCISIHPLIHSFIYSSIYPSMQPSIHSPIHSLIQSSTLHASFCLAMSVSPASTAFIQKLDSLEICHMLLSKQLHVTFFAKTRVHLQCNLLHRTRANLYLCLGLGIQDLAMCYHAQRCLPISPQTYASSYPQQCLLPILVEYDCTPRR